MRINITSITLGASIAAFLTGLGNYALSYSTLPKSNDNADLSVVYTGNNGRIVSAIKRFNSQCKQTSQLLLISGVSKKSSLSDVLKINNLTVPKECSNRIITGTHALKTTGNAKELKKFIALLNKNNTPPVQSIDLQTSWCHMPRAYNETISILPQNIKISTTNVSHCTPYLTNTIKELFLEISKLPIAQSSITRNFFQNYSYDKNGSFKAGL